MWTPMGSFHSVDSGPNPVPDRILHALYLLALHPDATRTKRLEETIEAFLDAAEHWFKELNEQGTGDHPSEPVDQVVGPDQGEPV